jgi:hypothetical protein
MPEQYEPSEFSEILNSPERPLIVGGQAVNLWAEFFAPRNAKLRALRPFVSKDADIFGDRTLAQKLADAAGWEIRFFHEPRTIAVAVLIKRRGKGEALTVEVLRSVRGLTQKELADTDLVELRPGHIYRIPSPVRLLKAKLANLHEIKPVRPQDIRHVHLLVILTQEYLYDFHRRVADKQVSQRSLINALHELQELIDAKKARALAVRHELNLAAALPISLPTIGMPKLAAFYSHRDRDSGEDVGP